MEHCDHCNHYRPPAPESCCYCGKQAPRDVHNGLPTGPSIVDRNLDWSLVDLSIGARVARGVLYIDRVYPNTLAYLNPDTLDIALGDRCVLGQIRGRYVGTPEWDLGPDFCAAHGFVGFRVEGERAAWEDERDLSCLWRKEIYAARDRA